MKKIWILGLTLSIILAVTSCKTEEQIQQIKPTDSTTHEITVRQEPSKKLDIITVSGASKIMVMPDVAIVELSVVTQNPKLDKAQQDNSSAIDSVIAKLKEKGNDVLDRDISTSQFNMQPMYDYDKTPPAITGYRIENTLEVKLRNFDILGKIIGDAIAAGANTVTSICFDIEDTSKYYNEALSKAVDDAAQKAATLAKAGNVTLSDAPVSITEVSVNASPKPYNEMSAALATPPTSGANDSSTAIPLTPGETEITALVEVVYAMDSIK